ncbi:uncharacterized protein LOC107365015 [Tetranychus urticae]|uniref:Uncharacterized protein n=1 Tax=Tetranychus urticae TaxID=32264 RepID=T1KK37_TETUR|nr:uncharacterized protein LOC107365015 [Tetranychus urticae]XP_015787963.1 uncharacterized protein LOC107365015 [Tetranychus urticae]XP_015787965.1 uncharacterized protein LOC107365015 [Tetranychus urticae]XP_015787966.1 uncharacterized protein LOC107365015 [Tetranychus urticae]XP_025017158.1 uncharacterized protein LOC107365015 [Tetranychus urticae]
MIRSKRHQNVNPVLYRSCFLRLPYASILATLIAICGLVIAMVSLGQSTMITDRLLNELLHRKHIWYQEAQWIYSSFSILVSITILINLLIGCMTTGRRITRYGSVSSCGFCGKLTTILLKMIFGLNYLLFLIILILTLIGSIALFNCYVMSRLCNDGLAYSSDSSLPSSSSSPLTTNGLPEETVDLNQSLNLKIFGSLLSVRSNETSLLLFKGHRLKKLCIDYISSLYLYLILTFTGFLLLTWGFINFLINLSVNMARIATRRKCAELIYINSPEMANFVKNINKGRF